MSLWAGGMHAYGTRSHARTRARTQPQCTHPHAHTHTLCPTRPSRSGARSCPRAARARGARSWAWWWSWIWRDSPLPSLRRQRTSWRKYRDSTRTVRGGRGVAEAGWRRGGLGSCRCCGAPPEGWKAGRAGAWRALRRDSRGCLRAGRRRVPERAPKRGVAALQRRACAARAAGRLTSPPGPRARAVFPEHLGAMFLINGGKLGGAAAAASQQGCAARLGAAGRTCTTAAHCPECVGRLHAPHMLRRSHPHPAPLPSPLPPAAPLLFRSAWALIKPFLHERTLCKIKARSSTAYKIPIRKPPPAPRRSQPAVQPSCPGFHALLRRAGAHTFSLPSQSLLIRNAGPRQPL